MEETMLGCFQHKTSCTPVETMSINIVHMASLHADTLKYSFTDAFGYDKRKLVSTLGAVLMEKGTHGEVMA